MEKAAGQDVAPNTKIEMSMHENKQGNSKGTKGTVGGGYYGAC